MLALLGLLPVGFLIFFGRRFDNERVEKSQLRTWPLVLGLLLATGFVVRICVLAASPEPIIDVYDLLRDSADAIMARENPYK